LIPFNHEIYFEAYDSTHGYELWKSDGTEAGTVLVKDIFSGSSSFPSEFTHFNGKLYFAAIDNDGNELRKTDGTEVGTVLVKDIMNGTDESDPRCLTEANNVFFFVAKNPDGTEELWKSDGSEAGTVVVKNGFVDIDCI